MYRRVTCASEEQKLFKITNNLDFKKPQNQIKYKNLVHKLMISKIAKQKYLDVRTNLIMSDDTKSNSGNVE